MTKIQSFSFSISFSSDYSGMISLNGGVKCHFMISNAVNADGTAASLQYIDFVKVQTAVSYTDSPLGEISTEILNIFDESK